MTDPANIQTVNTQTVFKKIAVDQIHPNSFNPNKMGEEEFEQYVEEVEHLERLPKPIIVRLKDSGYEIIDGEHGWRAAQEAGLTEVLCEIVEIDGFEARRQCFKRNRGGTDDPVRLGKMFQEMKQERNLSTRKLAEEINISEATIRNYLLSTEAAEMRSRHTGESSEAEIAEMTRQAVRTYLRLPDEMRDVWLDSGGSVDDLEEFCEDDLSQIVYTIRQAELFWVLKPGVLDFRPSLAYALQLSGWRHDHRHLQNVDDYIRPVAELRLPVTVLDHLPCTVVGETVEAALPAGTWATILHDVSPQAGNEAGLCSLVDSAVRVALRRAGIELDAVYGPHVAEMLQLLKQAPEFICQADYMTLEEQFWLATVEVDEAEELALAAKQATCERLLCQRGTAEGEVRKRCASESSGVEKTFWECLEQLQHEETDEEEDALFADPDRLYAAVYEKLAESPAVCDGVIDDEPAVEVLAKRLDLLDWPEFYFMASLVLHSGSLEAAGQRWLEAAGRSVEEPTDS